MQIHEDMRFQKLIERMESLYIENCLEEMRLLLEQLQTLAETEQDDIGLAAAYFYRDLLSDTPPGSDSYMQYAKRALKIAQVKNIPYYQMKASNSLGIMYSEISDFHTSLEHYSHAIQVAENHPEFCYASVVLNNVGNLFVWLEDYTEASIYLERAYQKVIEQNQNDRQLKALIILNLVELYSNMQNYEKVREWKEKNISVFEEEELRNITCIEIINEAKNLAYNGQNAAAVDKMYEFINKSLSPSDYIYMFRCYINALRLGMRLQDFTLCSRLMDRMEQLHKLSSMKSFSYDYATMKVEYYQAFSKQLEVHRHDYFEEYYLESQDRIEQLRSTYARSLSVKTALEEITEENKNVHLQNELLQRDMERDIFTNLYNKVSTQKHVCTLMENRKNGQIQGLLLIDIDLFKHINDNFGHGFGDKVIFKVAEILESLSGSPNIAGRFGGDEFLVFLDHPGDLAAVKKTAETLLARVSKDIVLPDERVREVTLSIGICLIASHITFDKAFNLADQALYRAKELGRNRYEISQK